MTAIVSQSFNADMWSTQKSRIVAIPSNQLYTPEDSPIHSATTMAPYHASMWPSCQPALSGCSSATLGAYSPPEFDELSEPSPTLDELALNMSNFDDFYLGESMYDMDAHRAGPNGLNFDTLHLGPVFNGIPEEKYYPEQNMMPQTLANGQFPMMDADFFYNQQRQEAPSPAFSSVAMSRGNSSISNIPMLSNSPRYVEQTHSNQCVQI